MKKILLCLVAMAAGQCIVLAQVNYLPGVVITRQNDSLRGLINVKNWVTNPGEIDFKSDKESASHLYKATEINGFVIPQENKVYLSKEFIADVTYYETSTLKEQAMSVESLDTTAFVEQLVGGSYPLYTYTDVHHRDHYLFEAPGRPVTELVYIKTIVATDDGSGLYERKIYQQQLDTLFQDDPQLAKQNRFLGYYEKPLVKAFLAYNKFKDPTHAEEIIQKKKVRNPVWFGVMAGVGFNSYKSQGPFYMANGNSYKSSVNPMLGIFIDIPFPGSSRKFSLYNELLYKTISTSSVLVGPVYNDYAGDIVSFGFGYAQLNIMAQYTYPKGIVRPFIHVGMGNAIVVKTNKNDYYDVDAKKHETAVDGIRKHEESAILGIGVKASRLQVEARFSTGSGWLSYSSSNITSKALQIVAGFRL
ncbi:outer membrane beta-barrel protein [Chitinophaga sp.]|uniref:outer membrane beta-barrel protein n=1 Tax=Chitinophaga sp. TaxID=1869181 RepID=UPI0031D4FC81